MTDLTAGALHDRREVRTRVNLPLLQIRQSTPASLPCLTVTVFLFGFISGLLARATRRARERHDCIINMRRVIWGPPGSWKEGSLFSRSSK